MTTTVKEEQSKRSTGLPLMKRQVAKQKLALPLLSAKAFQVYGHVTQRQQVHSTTKREETKKNQEQKDDRHLMQYTEEVVCVMTMVHRNLGLGGFDEKEEEE